MAKLGRRGFIAALGFGVAAAPVAGPALMKTANPTIGGGAIGGYAGGINWGAPTTPSLPWESRGVAKIVWDAWNAEAREAQRRVNRYQQCALSGLDPVAAVSRSWSPVFRQSFSINRLQELIDDAERKDRILWDRGDNRP